MHRSRLPIDDIDRVIGGVGDVKPVGWSMDVRVIEPAGRSVGGKCDVTKQM